MNLLVRAAASLLPAAIRDRYREQWLADVRDAPEAGLRPASIAFAAVAFAVTYDRPFPARRVPTLEQRAHRSRLAVGLALSAALLALSVYPPVLFVGQTGNGFWDFVVFFVSALLLVFAILAPVTALALVRGRRARIAVILLAVATTSPIVASTGVNRSDDIYLNGVVVFAIAAVLIVSACALLWRPSGHSLRAPIIGTLVVWTITTGGLVYGAGFAWPNRTPLFFGSDMAYYKEWVLLKQQFEALVNEVFVGWAITGLLLGIIVFIVGRHLNERRATALAIAASAISLLVASGVFGLLELGMGDTVTPVLLDPLRLIAQVLLVAVTLASVGGIRYSPRVRHRHDVEGAV